MNIGRRNRPIVFDKVLVNEGNAWNTSTNKVVIPQTGYYMVHFSAGIPARTRLWHWLDSSLNPLTLIFRDSEEHDGIDTLGKTIFRNFKAGDSLWITNSYNTFSNAQMQTTFMGLLLYEEGSVS